MGNASYYKGASGYTFLKIRDETAELLRIPRPGHPKALLSRFTEKEDTLEFCIEKYLAWQTEKEISSCAK